MLVTCFSTARSEITNTWAIASLAAQGRTVLVSSHLLAELAHTVDDVAVLAAGRLVAHRSVEELTDGDDSALETAYLQLTHPNGDSKDPS
jgi:ABC-2 type transport system ATP-binding protein